MSSFCLPVGMWRGGDTAFDKTKQPVRAFDCRGLGGVERRNIEAASVLQAKHDRVFLRKPLSLQQHLLFLVRVRYVYSPFLILQKGQLRGVGL